LLRVNADSTRGKGGLSISANRQARRNLGFAPGCSEKAAPFSQALQKKQREMVL
jgi:hypothetical protein